MTSICPRSLMSSEELPTRISNAPRFGHERMRRLVPERELLGGQGERDRALLAGFQADPLEAAQLQLRPFDARLHIAHIELRHLVAGDLAGVANVDAYGRRFRCPRLPARETEVRIGERRVAETVPEGVDRLALEIHVGEALRDVVLVHRRHLLV